MILALVLERCLGLVEYILLLTLPPSSSPIIQFVKSGRLDAHSTEPQQPVHQLGVEKLLTAQSNEEGSILKKLHCCYHIFPLAVNDHNPEVFGAVVISNVYSVATGKKFDQSHNKLQHNLLGFHNHHRIFRQQIFIL